MDVARALESLGAGAVDADQLRRMVADSLATGGADVEPTAISVTEVDYGLDSITTLSRHWVDVDAIVDGNRQSCRFFVKVVQAWSRSPQFQFVPPELREFAARTVPWRTEPLIYQSDLANRLPTGLSMPRAHHVDFLDDDTAALWLEAIDIKAYTWDVPALAHAAYLLGRLAVSPGVRELSAIGESHRRLTAVDYANGRVAMQILPVIQGDEIWHAPIIQASFNPALRARLQAATKDAALIAEELLGSPQATAHGDACSNNLLPRIHNDELVLIDFNYWSTQHVGFDLGQLVIGDVQIGRRRAECLPAIDDACIESYLRGVRDEGVDIADSVVRRAHALQLLLFSGISAVPLEVADQEPTPALIELARQRAILADFALSRAGY